MRAYQYFHIIPLLRYTYITQFCEALKTKRVQRYRISLAIATASRLTVLHFDKGCV